MVMDAVAEKNTLGIDHKLLEIIAFAIALIAIENGLQGLTDHEIMLIVLVEEDVAPRFGGLAQIIKVFLLAQGQVFPARDLVAHDADVGELVDEVFEVFHIV